MSENIDDDPHVRMAKARANLTEKLDELRRRELTVRETIAPIRHLRHLASPWVRVGLAALVGMSISKRFSRSPAPSTAIVPYHEPSILDALAKIATIAASSVVLYRAFKEPRQK
ncbi:hypothetical protein BH11MYX2_BH11MYX2_06250 [soil metagenome]